MNAYKPDIMTLLAIFVVIGIIVTTTLTSRQPPIIKQSAASEAQYRAMNTIPTARQLIKASHGLPQHKSDIEGATSL